jgi:hypothetical protein
MGRLVKTIDASTGDSVLDWEELKKDFVKGDAFLTKEGTTKIRYLTLQAFADKHHIPFMRIDRRAKKDAWLQAQSAVKSRREENDYISESDKSDLAFYSEVLSESDAATAKVASKLHSVLDLMIETKFGEVLQRKADDPESIGSDDVWGITSLKELESMTRMLNTLHSTTSKIAANAPKKESDKWETIDLKPIEKQNKESLAEQIEIIKKELAESKITN